MNIYSPVHNVSQAEFPMNFDIEGDALICPHCGGVISFSDAYEVYDPHGRALDFIDIWRCDNCRSQWNVHEG